MNETFGQIEAVRQWLSGKSLEYVKDSDWCKIDDEAGWKFAVLPNELIIRKHFRLAEPAPVKPEEEQLWICENAEKCEFCECVHRIRHNLTNECTNECRGWFKGVKGSCCIPIPSKTKVMVELGPEDVPPGSRFKLDVTIDGLLVNGGIVFHFTEGKHYFRTWQQLRKYGWLIQRPGEDWTKCEKEAK